LSGTVSPLTVFVSVSRRTTILRVVRGGSSTRIGSVEGGVVQRVTRPPARLVAP